MATAHRMGLWVGLAAALFVACTASDGDDAGATDGPGTGLPSAGMPCPVDQEGTLRCGDGAAFACMGGAYELAFDCPGLQQCLNIDTFDQVQCGGVNIGVGGSSCALEDDQVCTPDSEVVLVCQAGVWTEGIHCPPSNCTVVPESDGKTCFGSWCANCGYTEGDLCAFAPGLGNCSTDLRAIVQCSDGIVTVQETCPDAQTCTLFGDGTVDCA